MPDFKLELPRSQLAKRPNLKWTRHGEGVLPAWVAETDLALAEPALAELRQRLAQANLGYDADEERLDALLGEAFAGHARRRYGWQLDPGLVQPLSDIGQGVAAALWAFTVPGDGVVVQTPAYPRFRKLIEGVGRRFVANPLLCGEDGYGVDLDHLKRCFEGGARALVLCNPHNPTGRVFTAGELTVIGDLAERYGVTVIVDEVHADLTLDGQHLPMATLQRVERLVTLTSASKSFNVQALRCAVMVFSSVGLQREFHARVPPLLLGSVSPLGVKTSQACWAEGGDYLEALRTHLRARRDQVATFFSRHHPRVRFIAPQASYLFWLDFSALALPRDAAGYFLEHASVALSAGQHFDEDAAAFARLNFATSEAILGELLERLGRAIERSGDESGGAR